MEKYYLGKLSQLSQETITNDRTIKLVEIQFSRRLPTFGFIYLTQDTGQDQLATQTNLDDYDNYYEDQTSDNQQLLLSGLNLSSDNNAKLDILKRVRLTELSSANNLASGNTVVDFDIIGASLLIEGGSSMLSEQQLRQSMCILLTRDGRLLLISMIDCQIKYILNAQTMTTTTTTMQAIGSDRFIRCYLRATDEEDYTSSVYIYVLTEKNYSCFTIKTFSQINHKSQPQHSLLCHYSLGNNRNQMTQENWLKFTRLTPISQNSPVVMLELNDNSIRVINRQGGLLYSGPSFTERTSSSHNKQQLVLTSTLMDQQTIILTYTDSKIVAHSLLFDLDTEHRTGKAGKRDNEEEHSDSETKVGLIARAVDPDQLLPREPSFELETCWSLDLNDIDSIRSLDDQENEPDSCKSNEQPINGCLCALWSSNQLNESNWPKFLLITYKYYVLIYSFEQQTVLPFSIVYDRAFLGQQESMLASGDQQQVKSETSNAQSWQESIDLRMKPKLMYNFKLIGAQTTDLFVNTLFLLSRISLLRAKQFSQLGLVICLSSSGDLFAFKLTSSRLVSKKDNLYQQLLLDSIRGNSLLNEEIRRLQANNSSLNADISSLSSRTNHNIQQERHLLNNLDRMLQVSLKQRQLSTEQTGNEDGMFQLNLTWSNLIQVSRIVVVCSVNCFISNNIKSSVIKSIHVNNEPDEDEDDEEADRPLLLFRDNDSANQQDSEQAEGLSSEPIKSMALIDLHESQENVQISLPIFLIDGQSGEISVYFVLSTPKKIIRLLTTSNRPSSLIIADDASDMVSLNSNTSSTGQRLSLPTSQHISMKYYKKTIQIKPLVSYQYVSSIETPETNENVQLDQRLLINSPSGQHMLKDWLHECLQSPKSDILEMWHIYRSTFTHCHLDYKFNSCDSLTLVSDDFIALETIKKHLLKRATDLSIRLDISNSVPTIDNLRHLIGQQKSTLDQRITNGINILDISPSESKLNAREQKEILLESLLNQVNLNELPLDPKSIIPTWLERSLRQDVESLSTGQNEQATESSQGFNSTNKTCIMREIVFGFIIDALVDYDNLHNRRSSSDMMMKMRESLHRLLGGRALDLSQNQLIDLILAEWTALKRPTGKL